MESLPPFRPKVAVGLVVNVVPAPVLVGVLQGFVEVVHFDMSIKETAAETTLMANVGGLSFEGVRWGLAQVDPFVAKNEWFEPAAIQVAIPIWIGRTI